MTTLLDKLFFGAFVLVATFVAFRPIAFFRAISFGRFNKTEVAPGTIRVIQVIAAVAALSLGVRLLLDIFSARQ